MSKSYTQLLETRRVVADHQGCIVNTNGILLSRGAAKNVASPFRSGRFRLEFWGTRMRAAGLGHRWDKLGEKNGDTTRCKMPGLYWAIVDMRQQFTDSLAHLTHPDGLNSFAMAIPSTVSWDVAGLRISLH